jgi:oxygen-independent coproporphyrinogen-3 oxidase
VALYVHVPFCVALCPYCDFVVLTGRSARGPGSRVVSFLDALHVELTLRADDLDAQFSRPGGSRRPLLDSVYLGGGTPSLLTPEQVARLLEHADRRFGIASGAEVTLEANPGTGERGDLAGMRVAGVTRLSLGAQSFQDAELRSLGRRHRAADVRSALEQARWTGFSSISLDLLTDVPGQTLDSWADSLRTVIDLAPDHVSTYALTLDDPQDEGLTGPEGDHLPVRPGARRWRERARSGQDEDRAAAMDELADELLGDAGFERYELANHARPGHRSRHNQAYWTRRPVAALGPGAHAFDGALERRWNAARLDRYLAALLPADGSPPQLPPGGVDRLDLATARSESVILGLRLRDGIASETSVDPAFGPALGWASSEGLLESTGERVRLTPRGRLLSNELFARLVPAAA